MVVDHPAVKIVAGIFLGGAIGALAFASLRVEPAGQLAPVPVVTSTAPVAPVQQPVSEVVPSTAQLAPISAAGGPVWVPAPAPPRPRRVLLTESATFPCAARRGASLVNVGWAVALFGKHPARSKSAKPAPEASYSTSLAWGGEGMSLAVSCSPGAAAPRAATVAQAPAAPRPMVPLDYPAESQQPVGLQISGLFKPVTDAMP